MIDLKNLTIKTAHEHLVKGDFTAVELTQAYLDVIKEKNPEINAYVEVFADALEQAAAADVKIKEGKATILTGIPLGIKDNFLIKDRSSTSASKILEGHIATYDATVIEKLKSEGAIFLGRTNMDEFAMGGSTESSYYGPTKNPHDTTRVPGGSSGGSAAALAMDGALATLGSDTGGSIRQPASLCGLVGMKPTYGAVSRYGLMAMASSLDQIGPFAKTVEDAEILFNIIKGKDERDSTSQIYPKNSELPKKIRIGVPRDFLTEGVDADVLENFNQSLKKLENAGYEIKDISMPNLHYSLAVYYILMPAEASSNLSRFDGVKYGLHKDGKDLLEDYTLTRGEGFGKEVRRRIIVGTYVLSSGYYDAYYNKANAVRNLLINDFKNAYEEVDIVAMPTSPMPAFKIGEKLNDPVSMYLADIFTVSANLVGVPGMSIPSGTAEREGKQLPLGLQLLAPHFREDLLFAVGNDFEKIR